MWFYFEWERRVVFSRSRLTNETADPFANEHKCLVYLMEKGNYSGLTE